MFDMKNLTYSSNLIKAKYRNEIKRSDVFVDHSSVGFLFSTDFSPDRYIEKTLRVSLMVEKSRHDILPKNIIAEGKIIKKRVSITGRKVQSKLYILIHEKDFFTKQSISGTRITIENISLWLGESRLDNFGIFY